jgi:hypothetical protein
MRPQGASHAICFHKSAMKSLSKIRGRTTGHHHLLMTWLQAAILAISCQGLLAADGPISAVQDALKKEQLLSGEPSGVLDDATRDALRRFQIRRGLRASGEIDTVTLQALQSHPEESSSSPAVATESKGPGPTESTVEKDREFLQKVETGREQTPSAAAPAPVPVTSVASPSSKSARSERPLPPEPAAPAIASNPAKSENLKHRVDAPENRAVEKPRLATTARKVERAPLGQSSDSSTRREIEPDATSDAPARRGDPPISTASTKPVENVQEVEPPSGAKVTRIITTTTGPDGRTYVTEKKTTTFSGTPAPTIRRAEPIEPRRTEGGLFHRIFGNGND